ncbi:hemagglutinin, partial [Vibrio cholerae]
MKMKQRPRNWLVLAGAATGFPHYAAQMVTIDDASMVEQALAQQQYSMMTAACGFKAVNTVQLPNGKVTVRYQPMYTG